MYNKTILNIFFRFILIIKLYSSNQIMMIIIAMASSFLVSATVAPLSKVTRCQQLSGDGYVCGVMVTSSSLSSFYVSGVHKRYRSRLKSSERLSNSLNMLSNNNSSHLQETKFNLVQVNGAWTRRTERQAEGKLSDAKMWVLNEKGKSFLKLLLLFKYIYVRNNYVIHNISGFTCLMASISLE